MPNEKEKQEKLPKKILTLITNLLRSRQPNRESLSRHSENAFYGESGNKVFGLPSPEQLSYLATLGPKVEYVSVNPTPLSKHSDDITTLPDSFERWYSKMNNFGVGGNALNDLVFPDLEKNILQDMKDHSKEQVGLRGVSCSITKPIHISDPDKNAIVVNDIAQILEIGKERKSEETLISMFFSEEPEIHHRTVQWIVEHTQNLRASLSSHPELANEVFPVLLVYDTKKLKHGTGNYQALLADGVQSWSDALIKAYILPCPNKYKLEIK